MKIQPMVEAASFKLQAWQWLKDSIGLIMKGYNMNIKVYNEEGRLIASDEKTILELLDECGYLIDPSEEEMKKLRIKNGVDKE